MEDERDIETQSESLNDLTPEPILSVRSTWPVLPEAADDLGIRPHEKLNAVGPLNAGNPPLFHLHCGLEGLSYKEKTLNLFAFALLASKSRVCGYLWERKKLSETMIESVRGSTLPEGLDIPFKFEGELVMDPATQVHSRQSGFTIEVRDNPIRLSRLEIEDLLAAFLKIARQPHGPTTTRSNRLTRVA